MKIEEIIQRIQSLYSKGVQSDDSRLSTRHIYNKFLTVRTKLLSQKAKSKQKISDWNYQTINCIELIEVPLIECPCIPNIGCSVMRSKYKIPRIMSDYNSNIIDYLMSVDGGKKFDATNKSELLHIRGNKYTSDSERYLIENGYLFVYGKRIPEVVMLRALFEDPFEVNKFIKYCPENASNECFDILTTEFPIDADLTDVMIQLTAEELISIFSQMPQDVKNDNSDTQQQNQEVRQK